MDSPDWRLTQKWIGVEVPWKAEFEQKFRIVLKKESPVVLVFSQLDDRYFVGLQGQYSFRLQFRLHEVDSPGEEDYIVRSHGNYLMERSVVTELKSLKAGTYSIFIMVAADRDISTPSVEDVVKKESRCKMDNDKLAQVGMAYDLAHSKSAQYMTSQVAIRLTNTKAVARESRIATRRKAWETRHLQRVLLRKQSKKNDKKRERKAAKGETEEIEEEKKEPKDQGVQTDDTKEVVIEKKDKAIQTEEPAPKRGSPKVQPRRENDKDLGVQIEDFSGSTTSSQGTPSTRESSSVSSPAAPPVVRMHVGPSTPPSGYLISGQRMDSSSSRPPYPGRPPQRVQQYVLSDGESSASPVSDYADMYNSDDDQAPGTRQASSRDTSKQKKGSDDEDDPEPWNAVGIVGFRVYSKDEGLELRIHNECEVGQQKLKALDKVTYDSGTDADDEDGGVKGQEVAGAHNGGKRQPKDEEGNEVGDRAQ